MLSTIVFALLLPVQPQVSVGVGVDVEVAVPTVRFEVEPPLVLVSPGVVVVRDSDSEVFYANGFYWTSMRGRWYRTRSYRGGWVRMPARRVPYRISRVRHGSYRHYRGGRHYEREGRRSRRRDVRRGDDRRDRREIRDHRRGKRGRHSGRDDRRRHRR
jgi:hypothetical protein